MFNKRIWMSYWILYLSPPFFILVNDLTKLKFVLCFSLQEGLYTVPVQETLAWNLIHRPRFHQRWGRPVLRGNWKYLNCRPVHKWKFPNCRPVHRENWKYPNCRPVHKWKFPNCRPVDRRNWKYPSCQHCSKLILWLVDISQSLVFHYIYCWFYVKLLLYRTDVLH